jgi:hypothetical protein
MFNISRNNLGQVDAINRISDGFSVSYNPLTKIFGKDSITLEFLQWQKENNIYLNDIEPEQKTNIYYRVNSLLPSDCLISLDRFPFDLNYNTGLIFGLTTKTIDYFGLRIAQIFYQSLDLDFQSIEPIPIVFERYKYNWDEVTKYPTGRVKEIYFYQSDGQLSTEYKLLPKEFYNISDRADICNKRRESIVAWLIARSIELGLGDALKGFFAKYKDECDRYILYGDNKIFGLVASSQETWLNIDTKTPFKTVRNTIIFCLGKALEATSSQEIDDFLAQKLPEKL